MTHLDVGLKRARRPPMCLHLPEHSFDTARASRTVAPSQQRNSINLCATDVSACFFINAPLVYIVFQHCERGKSKLPSKDGRGELRSWKSRKLRALWRRLIWIILDIYSDQTLIGVITRSATSRRRPCPHLSPPCT